MVGGYIYHLLIVAQKDLTFFFKSPVLFSFCEMIIFAPITNLDLINWILKTNPILVVIIRIINFESDLKFIITIIMCEIELNVIIIDNTTVDYFIITNLIMEDW